MKHWRTVRQLFQSTLPHGERLEAVRALLYVDSVSIHAPARGATSPVPAYFMCSFVSIHAPARGATNRSNPFIFPVSSFNPRSRTGSDLHEHNEHNHSKSFNPRSRTGSDLTSFHITFQHPLFQSTLPHGERPDRSGEGFRLRYVSIHAPARGATSVLPFWGPLFCVSIHAPARGATYEMDSF